MRPGRPRLCRDSTIPNEEAGAPSSRSIESGEPKVIRRAGQIEGEHPHTLVFAEYVTDTQGAEIVSPVESGLGQELANLSGIGREFRQDQECPPGGAAFRSVSNRSQKETGWSWAESMRNPSQPDRSFQRLQTPIRQLATLGFSTFQRGTAY
jgi:hypothetical protein